MFRPRAVAPAPPYRPEPAGPDVDAAALAATAADLRIRLARVCAAMPAADFDALIDIIARRALRWATREYRAQQGAGALR
jgi:hypothetical protein